MRENEKKFNKNNVQIVVVTFEAGYLAQQYVAETGITWPLLVDEDRELYRQYGMLDASFWDIWGPKTWWGYFKEMVQGRLPKKSTGDISQRGGDVLLDQDGIVRLHYVGAGPADRPTVAAIFKALRAG